MTQYLARAVRRQLRALPRELRAWQGFWSSYWQYRRIAPAHALPDLEHLYPCLGEDTSEIGIEPVYFYQDAWAFERIVKSRPEWHLDVGSHHKFVALLSKVVPVLMVDLRSFGLSLESLAFRKGSILDIPCPDASVPSVSSLCVIEHIGLGRYGDELDWQGSEKAMAELRRVVAPGGDLYVSLPLDDTNRTYFNAHRAFHEEHVVRLFGDWNIVERRYIYGKDFVTERRSGFGVGCYQLRRPW